MTRRTATGVLRARLKTLAYVVQINLHEPELTTKPSGAIGITRGRIIETVLLSKTGIRARQIAIGRVGNQLITVLVRVDASGCPAQE